MLTAAGSMKRRRPIPARSAERDGSKLKTTGSVLGGKPARPSSFSAFRAFTAPDEAPSTSSAPVPHGVSSSRGKSPIASTSTTSRQPSTPLRFQHRRPRLQRDRRPARPAAGRHRLRRRAVGGAVPSSYRSGRCRPVADGSELLRRKQESFERADEGRIERFSSLSDLRRGAQSHRRAHDVGFSNRATRFPPFRLECLVDMLPAPFDMRDDLPCS